MRLRAVKARAPKRREPRPLQHERRIDAYRRRHKRRDQARRHEIGRPVCAVKPRHHLKAQFQPVRPDQRGRAVRIGRRVAAPVFGKHRVVHALRAQLNGRHTIARERIERFIVDTVRPRGYTHARKHAPPEKRPRRFQQFNHIRARHRRKAAAEKRDLRRSSLLRKLLFGPRAQRGHSRAVGRGLRARNGALIAEAALMRTARVRHKHRNVGVLHRPISLSASRAAACSALFLLPPQPTPITLLLSRTSTRNFLL